MDEFFIYAKLICLNFLYSLVKLRACPFFIEVALNKLRP